MRYVQGHLDLFDTAERAGRALAEWRARFERAAWIAPYPTAGGTPAGGQVPGWRCPDPECGEIEPGPTGFLLMINHGFDPDVPGHEPFDGRCWKVRHRRVTGREAAR